MIDYDIIFFNVSIWLLSQQSTKLNRMITYNLNSPYKHYANEIQHEPGTNYNRPHLIILK